MLFDLIDGFFAFSLELLGPAFGWTDRVEAFLFDIEVIARDETLEHAVCKKIVGYHELLIELKIILVNFNYVAKRNPRILVMVALIKTFDFYLLASFLFKPLITLGFLKKVKIFVSQCLCCFVIHVLGVCDWWAVIGFFLNNDGQPLVLWLL